MSEASSKPRHHPPGMTGHPALSRKTTRKPRPHRTSESSGAAGGKTIVSDTSSVISTSTRPNFNANTRLENTYRLDPNDQRKFQANSKVHDATYGILESYLCEKTYDGEKTPAITKDLAEMIKQRIREMNFERYKIVVTVILGEDTGQSMELASRFLWNTNTDNYVAVNYKNGNMFAVATVYGIYFE